MNWSHFFRRTLPRQSCWLCHAPSDETVCRACTSNLPWSAELERCPCCATPTPGAGTCGKCLRTPPPQVSCHTLLSYQFPVNTLIGGLKFGQQLALAHWLAQQFWLGHPQLACQTDLLLPMPLHPNRLRQRGFNQAQLIAMELGRLYDLPVRTDLCERIKDTAQQAKLDLQERQRNVRAAFRCKERLDGLRVAILDDVITTGSTVASLGHTLLESGADNVSVWALAHTPPG